MVVVLPEPLGPSKPKISPRPISKFNARGEPPSCGGPKSRDRLWSDSGWQQSFPAPLRVGASEPRRRGLEGKDNWPVVRISGLD